MNAIRIIKIAGVCASALLIATNVALMLYVNDTISRESKRLYGSFATIIADDAYMAIRSIESNVYNIKLKIYRELDLWPIATQKSIHQFLSREAEGIPFIKEIMLFTNNGKMCAHSHIFPTPEVDASGMSYFNAHYYKNLDAKSVYVTFPVDNPIDGEPAIQISAPMRGRLNGIDGVIVFTIDVNYFSTLFESINISGINEISLKSEDGTSFPMWRKSHYVPHDEVPSVLFTEKLRTYGLFITIDIPTEALYVTWRPVILLVMASTGLLALAMVGITAYAALTVEKFNNWDRMKKKAQWNPTVITGGLSDE